MVESYTARGLPELIQVVERFQFDDAVDFAPAAMDCIENGKKAYKEKIVRECKKMRSENMRKMRSPKQRMKTDRTFDVRTP